MTNYTLDINPDSNFDVDTCYTEEELNDSLVIAAIAYQKTLEKCGYIKSAIYFDPMLNELRDGDNKVILRMIKCYSGFAPFIAKNYSYLLPEIADKVGSIISNIH